jgi:hypothetical protein
MANCPTARRRPVEDVEGLPDVLAQNGGAEREGQRVDAGRQGLAQVPVRQDRPQRNEGEVGSRAIGSSLPNPVGLGLGAVVRHRRSSASHRPLPMSGSPARANVPRSGDDWQLSAHPRLGCRTLEIKAPRLAGCICRSRAHAMTALQWPAGEIARHRGFPAAFSKAAQVSEGLSGKRERGWPHDRAGRSSQTSHRRTPSKARARSGPKAMAGEGELVPRTVRPPRTQAREAQNALEVGEEHLDLLPLVP